MGVMTVTATGAATPDLAWQRYHYLQRWTSWAPHLTPVRCGAQEVQRCR